MSKFIPYEKLSKKEKRRLDAAKRGTWGGIDPVTRKPRNSKAYNRKRTQDWKKEPPDPVSFIYGIYQTANDAGIQNWRIPSVPFPTRQVFSRPRSLHLVRPVENTAEFLDVGVSQLRQDLRRQLAAAAAAAID